MPAMKPAPKKKGTIVITPKPPAKKIMPGDKPRSC